MASYRIYARAFFFSSLTFISRPLGYLNERALNRRDTP